MNGRRRFLRSAAVLAALPSIVRAGAAPGTAADFDALWSAIDRDYAYLERAQDWRAARARWRPRAAAAQSRDGLLEALEGALAELNDESVGLDAHLPASPRPVPSATDLWAEWVGGEAVIAAVRAGSVADAAGAVPGHRIVAVSGKPVERAVRALLRQERRSSPQARNWALRRLVAGPWAGRIAIDVLAQGKSRRIEIEREDRPDADTPPLIARRIGENRDLGYLRLKNNLGERGLVQHFDAALQHLRDTRGLVVDLRETQAGGSLEVARALAGRFTTTDVPWIRRAPGGSGNAGDGTLERIAPRGPFAYAGKVVALVDTWTAGEGESLAAGLRAAARAELIGTRMAGLRGEARTIRLPASGIALHFPALRVFLADGTPREAMQPSLPVDIVAPSGGPGDPILYQALKHFEVLPSAAARR